ncbi:MAG: hemerythrin domain-containing protein, partial [Betaproteobacteria bacterium]|nr:hemerythrin domain-containing protein [Betaproteobacteria bacterium]
EQRWARLREPLQAIQDGQPGLLEAREVQDFIDDYTRHIDYEEAEVLPMAARLLCDEQLDAIGRAMRLRRGGELPPDAA